MTTTVDPFGTPSVTYNRSGVSIVSVAANGNTQATATEIPAASGHTVAIITGITDNQHLGVLLPSDAEIGDVVEIYIDPSTTGNSTTVYPPSGESIGKATADLSFGVSGNAGALFRKVSPTNWQVLAG